MFIWYSLYSCLHSWGLYPLLRMEQYVEKFLFWVWLWPIMDWLSNLLLSVLLRNWSFLVVDSGNKGNFLKNGLLYSLWWEFYDREDPIRVEMSQSMAVSLGTNHSLLWYLSSVYFYYISLFIYLVVGVRDGQGSGKWFHFEEWPLEIFTDVSIYFWCIVEVQFSIS